MRSRAMTPGALRWKNATRNSAAGIDHMSQAVPARMAHDGTLRAGRPRLQSPDAWTTMCAAMEFGFSRPGRGPLAGAETILKLATKAESLRFSSLFVTDHVVLPASMARSTYPYSTTGQLPGGAAQDYLEPLVTMGWLARVTSRIRLGTSVLVVPYRNPVLVAKMLATIDRLSGGRVILGAGVGWLREEFEALAAPPFEARGAVTDEYLRLMRATELRGWAQQAGRDPKSVTLTVRVPMEVRPRNAKPPAGERPLFQGTATQVIADIRAYQAAGVTHFVFDPTVPDLKATLTNMDRFAHDVRGKVMKAPRA